MKSLKQFLLEKYEEELEIRDAINYEQFADLLMYLDQYDSFQERKQSICDVFRHSYSTNITKENIKSSKIFQRLIDDLVKYYNEMRDEPIKLNVSTRKHLEDDIAAKMLIKISLEQEMPKNNFND